MNKKKGRSSFYRVPSTESYGIVITIESPVVGDILDHTKPSN